MYGRYWNLYKTNEIPQKQNCLCETFFNQIQSIITRKGKETDIMNEKITEMLDTTIETLRRINTDAASIFNVILNIWVAAIHNNNDILVRLFTLRKELMRLPYADSLVPLKLSFNDNGTTYVILLHFATEMIELRAHDAATDAEEFSILITNEPTGYRLNLTWFGKYENAVTAILTPNTTVTESLPAELRDTKGITALSNMYKLQNKLYRTMHIYKKTIIEKLISQSKWYTDAETLIEPESH
jgi:hypothetical protein